MSDVPLVVTETGYRLDLTAHDERVRAAAVAPVLALCDEWDALSKGPSPTTVRIRERIAEGVRGDV